MQRLLVNVVCSLTRIFAACRLVSAGTFSLWWFALGGAMLVQRVFQEAVAASTNDDDTLLPPDAVITKMVEQAYDTTEQQQQQASPSSIRRRRLLLLTIIPGLAFLLDGSIYTIFCHGGACATLPSLVNGILGIFFALSTILWLFVLVQTAVELSSFTSRLPINNKPYVSRRDRCRVVLDFLFAFLRGVVWTGCVICLSLGIGTREGFAFGWIEMDTLATHILMLGIQILLALVECFS